MGNGMQLYRITNLNKDIEFWYAIIDLNLNLHYRIVNFTDGKIIPHEFRNKDEIEKYLDGLIKSEIILAWQKA